MLRAVQINANKNSQNLGGFVFFPTRSSWAGATRFILHSSNTVTNIASQGEEIARVLDEMYHACLLCELTMCLQEEQHLDSATLEACHNLGKCVWNG